ncbi:major capsid protein [Bosea sp. (in: a-proteobacteria)]|uniref:major capsid protein n=1 Tax=Bosea sp. (in: a-proteobacteria) TaxID=1871050 RepID=UPI0027372B8E|nr:major capsid protein [Bosea sp. (in: a-proteobacteria)]MDP3407241.1 major capsid protein [Bosea sp. (in: a-proteobacteria)]
MEFVFPFDSVTLTNQVNLIPSDYGMLNALNLFPAEPISSTVVGIHRVGNQIRVLPSVPRGARGAEAASDGEKIFYVEVPHFPIMDTIGPLDLQNKAAIVDGRAMPMTVEMATAKKLMKLRRQHAITREYLKFAALKGLVKDGNGKTIVDLYAFFGIAKKTVDLVLGTNTTEIVDKFEEIRTSVLTGVQGDTVSRVEVVIGSTLMNRLLKHAKFEKYWLNTPSAQELVKLERHRLGQDFGRIIDTGTLLLRESVGQVPVKVNDVLTNEALMSPTLGVAYPAGTTEMFTTYDAPPHHIEAVNEPGMEIFISEEVLKHGEGAEMKSQSNPLPIVKRPEALVEIVSSN